MTNKKLYIPYIFNENLIFSYVLRMKEFERESRLQARQKRIEH